MPFCLCSIADWYSIFGWAIQNMGIQLVNDSWLAMTGSFSTQYIVDDHNPVNPRRRMDLVRLKALGIFLSVKEAVETWRSMEIIGFKSWVWINTYKNTILDGGYSHPFYPSYDLGFTRGTRVQPIQCPTSGRCRCHRMQAPGASAGGCGRWWSPVEREACPERAGKSMSSIYITYN